MLRYGGFLQTNPLMITIAELLLKLAGLLLPIGKAMDEIQLRRSEKLVGFLEAISSCLSAIAKELRQHEDPFQVCFELGIYVRELRETLANLDVLSTEIDEYCDIIMEAQKAPLSAIGRLASTRYSNFCYFPKYNRFEPVITSTIDKLVEDGEEVAARKAKDFLDLSQIEVLDAEITKIEAAAGAFKGAAEIVRART